MGKKTETVVAVVETEERALTTAPAMAVATQAQAGDTRGHEGIDRDVTKLAYLAIAQKTSKILDELEAVYNPAAKFLDLYNSVTGEIYPEKVEFIPMVSRRRACLINPNGTNGQAVPWDDPRVQFDETREKPEGRRIIEWAVILLPTYETVILSFQAKNFPMGVKLNSFVSSRRGVTNGVIGKVPPFAGKYQLSVKGDKNDKGSWGQYVIFPSGPTTGQEYEFVSALYDTEKARLEAKMAAADKGESQASDGSIPF